MEIYRVWEFLKPNQLFFPGFKVEALLPIGFRIHGAFCLGFIDLANRKGLYMSVAALRGLGF